MPQSFEESREPCPCGKGIVIHWVKEDDHLWGNWGTYPWTEIRCEECAAKERRKGTLSAEQIEKLKPIDDEKRDLDKELEEIRAAVVNSAFASYPSIAAEHRALTAQKLYSGSYDMYRRWRAGSVYNAVRSSVTNDWVRERCNPEQQARIDAILSRMKELDAQARSIRQRPAPS